MNTICAISTPYGVGGIAILRISGPESITITDSLYRGRKPLAEAKAGTVHYGHIVRKDEILDEVMVTVMRAPHSFTGEDVVEIACHGSLYIQQELLRWLIDGGCRMARAGEFTQRAFLSGKMDLSRAEAVADLIAAQSKAEKDLALSQLRGGISERLNSLREQLLQLTSLIELELDFADHEELEFADRTELSKLCSEIEQHISHLTSSFRTGNAIKNGIPVAIVGATNAGKSTLLNALLGDERAIVSDIHGTTRDTIEDTVSIAGVTVRLIDTAGLRETDDTIESLGIERSRQAMAKAAIVVHVIDATSPTQDEIAVTAEQQLITVMNKQDLIASRPATAHSEPTNPHGTQQTIYISAATGKIAPLMEALTEAVKNIMADLSADHVCISNMRHFEALSRALEAIRRVQSGMADGLSGELLSLDLQDCLHALGEITGQITSEDVLGNIFSKFCIGK